MGLFLGSLFCSIDLSVHSDQTRKREIKGIQIGKVEVKMSLSADDMIVFIENPKTPPKYYLS